MIEGKSVVDLQKLREEAKDKLIAMRTCWNCNSAHEHFKGVDDCVIYCPQCGDYFYKGVKITE